MINPITIQMIKRHQVSASSEVIIAKHTRIPKIGNCGKYGQRYNLGRSGRVYRRIITPAQTMINAKSVPIEVILPSLEIGKNPAKKPVNTMKSKFERHGVRHVG